MKELDIYQSIVKFLEKKGWSCYNFRSDSNYDGDIKNFTDRINDYAKIRQYPQGEILDTIIELKKQGFLSFFDQNNEKKDYICKGCICNLTLFIK